MSLPVGQWPAPYQARLDQLGELIGRIANPSRPFRVLEAGAGATSNFVFPEGSEITGIDVSEQQLERNTRLAHKVLGDIQAHRFERDSFDMAVCWNVLEHLADPLAAVDRMIDALAPGGILVIASPNLWSVKGLLTRFTPHRFHTWFHRRVLGRANAGVGDVGPFRTFLSAAMAPKALTAHVRSRGFEVVQVDEFEGNQQTRLRDRSRAAKLALDALRVSRPLTRGRADLTNSDYIAVFQRPAH